MSEMNLNKLAIIMKEGFDVVDKRLDSIDGRLLELRDMRHTLDSIDCTVGDMTSVSVLKDIRGALSTLATRIDELELLYTKTPISK